MMQVVSRGTLCWRWKSAHEDDQNVPCGTMPGYFLNGRRFLGISASALKLPMFLFHVERSQLGIQTMKLIHPRNQAVTGAPVDVPRETTSNFARRWILLACVQIAIKMDNLANAIQKPFIFRSRCADTSAFCGTHQEETPQRMRDRNGFGPLPGTDLLNVRQVPRADPENNSFSCYLLRKGPIQERRKLPQGA
jgi:hypothetical protein